MSQQVSVTYTLHDKVTTALDKINASLDKYEARLKALDERTEAMSKDKTHNLSEYARKSQESFKTLNTELDNFNKQVNGTKRITLEAYTKRVGLLGEKSFGAQSKVNLMSNALNSNDEVLEQLIPRMEQMIEHTLNQGYAAQDTAKHLRDQKVALREVRDETNGFARSMQTIQKTEVSVKRAMDLKNKSAKQQSHLLKEVGRAADFAERRLRGGTGGLNRYTQALKKQSEFSFFGSGFEAGTGFYKLLVGVTAMFPLLGVAMGGVLSSVNSLGAGIVGLGGSLTSLAGTLALMPGLYASMGVAMIGAKSIVSQIIEPSTKGVEELKELQKQLKAAQASAVQGPRNSPAVPGGRSIASRRNSINLREAAQLASEGGQTALQRSEIQGAREALRAGTRAGTQGTDFNRAKSQEAALTRVKDIQDKIAKLQATMPANAQKLNDKIESLKLSWRAIWFGNDQKRANQIIDQLIAGIEGLEALIASVNPEVQRLVNFFGKVAMYVNRMGQNVEFQNLFGAVLDSATLNLEIMFRIFQNLLPYGLKLMLAMQAFTREVLLSVEGWSKQERNAQGFHRYLQRAFESLMVWTKALKNFGAGFLTLFSDANGATDLFEGSLLRMSERWREWTAEVTANGKAAQYFENSWKVLGALGGVFISIGKAMGIVGIDKDATDSVVYFLRQVGAGIERFGRYSRDMVSEVGPKLSAFFTELGEALKVTSGPMATAVGAVVDLFTNILKMVNGLPDPILVGAAWLTSISMAMSALGFALGHPAGPMALAVGNVTKVTKAFGSLKKMIWGTWTAQMALNAASGPLGGFPVWGPKAGPKIPGGKAAANSNANKGVDALRPFGPATSNAATGADARAGTKALSTAPAVVPAVGRIAAVAAAIAGAATALAVIAVVLVAVGAAVYAVKTNFMGVADWFDRQWSVTIDRFKKAWGDIIKELGGSKKATKDLNTILDGLKWILGLVGAVVVWLGTGLLYNLVNPILLLLKLTASLIKRFKEFWANLQSGQGIMEATGRFIWGFFDDMVRAMGSIMAETLISIFGDPLERAIGKGIDALNRGIEKVNQIRAALGMDKYDLLDKPSLRPTLQKGAGEDNAAQLARSHRDPRMGTALPKPNTVSNLRKGAIANMQSRATTSEVYNTGAMPGYTQTTPKGAEVKWNMSTIQAFANVTRSITDSFKPLFWSIKSIPNKFTSAANRLVLAIQNAAPRIHDAMELLSAEMIEPLSRYLGVAVDEVKAILRATNTPMGNAFAALPGESLVNRGGGRGVGDSNIQVAGGGGMTSGLSPAMAPALRAAAGAGATVSSGLRNGPGDRKASDHYTGHAIDLVPPSVRLAHIMNSLPGVKQVIYSPAGWSRNGGPFTPVTNAAVKADHYDHVHVAMGGSGRGGRSSNLAALSGVSAVPSMGKGSGALALKALGRKAYGALTSHVGGSGWFGRGGSLVTNGPGVIGVGDMQREHVQVTPLTGPNAPKNQGSRSLVIQPTVVIQGGIFTNPESIKQLSNAVGAAVSKDVVAALRSEVDGSGL